MAKPITPTPVLEEKEAQLFIKEIDDPNVAKASKEEVLEAYKLFERLKKQTEFTNAL
ncbi:MAG: hypothetical protein JW873_03220 [Candidatus Saganbacteria bacterium]|nr:hypothetical protein [Candidatus Saganbacteria bacterium]